MGILINHEKPGNYRTVFREIGGEMVDFSPDDTRIRIYKDTPQFNHVEKRVLVANGEGIRVGVRRFFDTESIIYLGGLLMKSPNRTDEEVDILAGAMKEDYGWNAIVQPATVAPDAVVTHNTRILARSIALENAQSIPTPEETQVIVDNAMADFDVELEKLLGSVNEAVAIETEHRLDRSLDLYNAHFSQKV